MNAILNLSGCDNCSGKTVCQLIDSQNYSQLYNLSWSHSASFERIIKIIVYKVAKQVLTCCHCCMPLGDADDAGVSRRPH